MFAILPLDPSTFCAGDAEVFDTLKQAKESALDWSVELEGCPVEVFKVSNFERLSSWKPLGRIWA